MKLNDVLEMLESESTDERKARRKATYFELYEPDEKQYRVNRKSKRDFDDEANENDRLEKRRQSYYDRSKRV